MHDPIHDETAFGWVPTGAWVLPAAQGRGAQVPRRGSVKSGYDAFFPSTVGRQQVQLGEKPGGLSRQLGEFECGSGDR